MYYNQGPTYQRNCLDPECSGNRDFILFPVIKCLTKSLLTVNNRPSLVASGCCDINGSSLGLQKCSESTATCGVVGPDGDLCSTIGRTRGFDDPTKQARGETTLAPCMQCTCFGLSVTPLIGIIKFYDYELLFILFVILVIVLLIFCIILLYKR